MRPRASPTFSIAPQYQPDVRRIGLDGETVFTHPEIKAWRSIGDRENCTLDFEDDDGKKSRWHIKRYAPVKGETPAEREVAGIQLLQQKNIPAVPLVGWGVLPDGRSFVIVEDLTGFRPADKALDADVTFDRLLGPTADLAGRLHASGLHHRDLYLCHFFARNDAGSEEVDLRLIDCARVKPLPRFLTRSRWIVKDLAQFWYSARSYGISDDQRMDWLRRYAEAARSEMSADRLLASIRRKIARIARHDLKLKEAQPNRNISIPLEHSPSLGTPGEGRGGGSSAIK